MVNKFSEEWGLSRKTVEFAISDALKFMRDEATKETLIAMNMERLDNIISDSMSEKDRKSAIKGIEVQSKLAGGFEEKIKLEGDSTINLDFGLGE